ALYYDAVDGIHRDALDGSDDRLVVAGANSDGGLAVAPDGAALARSDCHPHHQLLDLGGPTPSVLREVSGLRTPATGPGGVSAWIEGPRAASSLMMRQADGTVVQIVDGKLGGLSSP